MGQVIEGTWEEITRRAGELAGHRLRVTVLDSKPQSTEKDDDDVNPNALEEAVSAMVNRTPEERAAAQARAVTEFQPENQLPPGQTVIDAVFGKWPGEETDEEVSQALERLS